jgi:hypothetical protein
MVPDKQNALIPCSLYSIVANITVWRMMRNLNSFTYFGEKHITARGSGALRQKIQEGGMKKKKLLFILFFVVLALPYAVFAGELFLIKGKGVPVCEAHYKNLEEMHYVNYMVCDRDKYYPEQNGITRPKWQGLDLKENKELVKKIQKFLGYGDQFEKVKMFDDKDEYEGYLEEIRRIIGDTMFLTMVDVDNDGKEEKIILYNDGRCMETHAYSRALLVLDEANNQIDVKKTEPLLQNTTDLRADIRSKAVESNYQMYDVFFYKDQTYFDKWNMRNWTLSVYIDSKGKTKEVCNYKYKK